MPEASSRIPQITRAEWTDEVREVLVYLKVSTRVCMDRYSGASLGYQLGAIAGGALAPLIATVILARYGSLFSVSVYIAIACFITIVSTMRLPETNPRSYLAALVESRNV